MRGRSYGSGRAASRSVADAAGPPRQAGGLEHLGRAVARGVALPVLGVGLLVDHLARHRLLEVEPRTPEVVVDDLRLGVTTPRRAAPLVGRRCLLFGDVLVARGPQRDDVLLELAAAALHRGAAGLLGVERGQL